MDNSILSLFFSFWSFNMLSVTFCATDFYTLPANVIFDLFAIFYTNWYRNVDIPNPPTTFDILIYRNAKTCSATRQIAPIYTAKHPPFTNHFLARKFPHATNRVFNNPLSAPQNTHILSIIFQQKIPTTLWGFLQNFQNFYIRYAIFATKLHI